MKVIMFVKSNSCKNLVLHLLLFIIRHVINKKLFYNYIAFDMQKRQNRNKSNRRIRLLTQQTNSSSIIFIVSLNFCLHGLWSELLHFY